MKKEFTYASIVPLVGGENLGIMAAMNNQLPEWILSYTDFAENDSHFINYLREVHGWKGKYLHLNADDFPKNYVPESVDIVNAVCPCAGLSSFSTTSSVDSATNEWMYKTAEYVLETVKPKVFWGENAPRLYTKAGEKVANKLFDIGQKNGYTLNLYQTQSRLHGIAQKRPRTFYFFTKEDGKVPIFRYIRRPMESIEELLSRPLDKDDPMNHPINPKDPMDNPWLRFCMDKNNCETIQEYWEKIEGSTNLIVESDNLTENLSEVADWMDANGYEEKMGNRARAMQQKKDDNKGYWAHGITLPKGAIPAFIGAMPASLIHPFESRFLTFREGLRIMKMPDDFNLLTPEDGIPRNANVICQNVPVTTAKDMADFVLEYLRGDVEMASGNLVRQSNLKMAHTVDHREESTLEDFIS